MLRANYHECDPGPGVPAHAGASFPQVRIAKKPNGPTNRLERPSLQHELLALSGCCGLRIFASFLKLDQAYPPEKPRAPRTQNSLQTIGWSEAGSVKVTIPSSLSKPIRSRTRHSGWSPFTMWTSFHRTSMNTHPAVAEVRLSPHSPIFDAPCSTRKIRCQMRSQLNSQTGRKHPFHITNDW